MKMPTEARIEALRNNYSPPFLDNDVFGQRCDQIVQILTSNEYKWMDDAEKLRSIRDIVLGEGQ